MCAGGRKQKNKRLPGSGKESQLSAARTHKENRPPRVEVGQASLYCIVLSVHCLAHGDSFCVQVQKKSRIFTCSSAQFLIFL